jgi:RHS repeat-associated protein
MQDRRTARIVASLVFAACRRFLNNLNSAAPAAAFLGFAALFSWWGVWSASGWGFSSAAWATEYTTTVLGTLATGSVTGGSRGAFGLPASTTLAGYSFTLVYTTDDSAGTGTITNPPVSSYIESTTTSNPVTAVLTVNNVPIYLGTQSYTEINSTAVEQAATSSGDVQYTFGEDYGGVPWSGSASADVDVYFSNPAYNANYLWNSPLYTYSPTPGMGLTSGSFLYDLGYDDGVSPTWTEGASGTFNISSIAIGLTSTSSLASTDPNNYGCMCPPQTTDPVSTGSIFAGADYSPPATTGGMSQPSDNGGDPISAGTGNQFTHETDFIGGPNTHLSFSRYYNSLDLGQAGLGVGWHSTYHHGLAQTTSTSVTVTRADGRQDVYTLSGGNWSPSTNVTSALATVTSGGIQTGWTLTLPDDSVESYTLGGQLSTIKTRNGLTTALGYTSSLLTTVTGPFGQSLGFQYDVLSRLTTMSVPDGNKFSYGYGQNNNLAYVKHPDGTFRSYQYQLIGFPNLMTGIYDENGNLAASWTYDNTGRALTSQRANGVQLLTLSYTSTGVTTAVDALGNTTSYALTTNSGLVQPSSVNGAPLLAAGGASFGYDGNGFVNSVTDFDGNVTTYTYAANGEQSSRTEASGTGIARTTTTQWSGSFHLPVKVTELGRTTSYTYDGSGDLTNVSVTDGTYTRSWTYTYNGTPLLISAADGLGNTTTYTYDGSGNLKTMKNALGQVTTFNSYNVDGWLLSMTDANSLTTSYTYNWRGQVLTKKVGGEETDYTYDPTGMSTEVLYYDDSYFKYTYDQANRRTQVKDVAGDYINYSYDAMSNLTGVNVYDPSNNLKQTTTYSYGVANRLLTANGAALGETTTYAWDNEGNMLSVTDPLSHTTSYGYDALNRRITLTDALSNTATYTFNNLNQLTMVEDPLGLTTTYSYDGMNDRLGQSSPDSGVTSYIYDAAGNLVSLTDALSQTTTYKYDALNRTVTESYSGGSAGWAYDTGTYGIGHLAKMTDNTGSTSYTYDQHGRILTKSQVTSGVTLTSTYQYDGYGRPQWFQYPSGDWILYAFDSSGRVDLVDYSIAVTTTTYTPFGPVTGWTEPNSTKVLRTFDQDGRITGITLSSTTTANINTQTLTYDNASRITQLAESGLTTKSYGYDAVNHLTSFFNGTNTQSLTYDNNGNRLSSTLSGTTTYNYTANTNQLSGLIGTTTQSFTTNADGNQTYDGTHTWSYDGRGLAVSVTAAAATTTYGINGFGQRLAKTATGISGGKNEYVYDEKGHLIGEYGSTGTSINETVYMPNTPVAILSKGTGLAGFDGPAAPVSVIAGGATVYSVTPDWLSTPHIIQNSSKGQVWFWDHYAFGDNAPTGSLTYNLRFPGQYADSESGTNDNGARIYSPNIPTYLQSDPIGLGGTIPGTTSIYPYVGSNPLTNVDPRGLYRDFGEPCYGTEYVPCVETEGDSDPDHVIGPIGGLPQGQDPTDVSPTPTNPLPYPWPNPYTPPPTPDDPANQNRCPRIKVVLNAQCPGIKRCIYQCAPTVDNPSGQVQLEIEVTQSSDPLCPPSIVASQATGSYNP